jgi:hypothetical protein
MYTAARKKPLSRRYLPLRVIANNRERNINMGTYIIYSQRPLVRDLINTESLESRR